MLPGNQGAHGNTRGVDRCVKKVLFPHVDIEKPHDGIEKFGNKDEEIDINDRMHTGDHLFQFTSFKLCNIHRNRHSITSPPPYSIEALI